MKKFGRILLVICMLVLVSGCKSTGGSDGGTSLKVGTAGGFNRIIYQEGGEWKGFEAEFWQKFAEKYGYDLEFTLADFSALFGMLDNGSIDIISNQITQNEQRLEKYDFTDPYCYIDYQFIVAEDVDVTSIDWFKGKKIATTDTANARFVMEGFNETYDLGMQFTYLSDTSAVNKMIAQGTYDCTFSAAITAQLSIDSQGEACKVVDPRDLSVPDGKDVFGFYEVNCFPVKKGTNEKLVSEVNEFIAEMRKSGELSALCEKYVEGYDFTNEPVIE